MPSATYAPASGFRRLILRDLPSLREYRVAWEVGLDVRVEDVVVDV